METNGTVTDSAKRAGARRPALAYSVALFGAALAACALGFQVPSAGGAGLSPPLGLFFIAFGLYTIEMGYVHPRMGYVSFDRVAQVASILVLGPVAAAVVNGIASLVFPWQRLLNGASLASVVTASLHNAGLMALIVLLPGSVYVGFGGPVPLAGLDAGVLALLFGLVLSMQLLNDLGMRVYFYLRDGHVPVSLNLFALAVETGAGLTGVLVAIVFNRMETSVVALLLAVLAAGMLALTQFARMRTRLEQMVEDRTRSLKEKTRQLEHLAARDQLTGLYNRRHADETLDRLVVGYREAGEGFAIALVDLDHFKTVNDRYSHEAGDEVLKRVARLFEAGCRQHDVVARYGGEEFLLCFPGADPDEAVEICDALRTDLLCADWGDVVPGFVPSLSAGVAGMAPGETRETLLRRADQRLYRAKSEGRNRVIGG